MQNYAHFSPVFYYYNATVYLQKNALWAEKKHLFDSLTFAFNAFNPFFWQEKYKNWPIKKISRREPIWRMTWAKNTCFQHLLAFTMSNSGKKLKNLANLDRIPLFEKNRLATNWISETCGTQEQFIYAHMENDFCPKNVKDKSLANATNNGILLTKLF